MSGLVLWVALAQAQAACTLPADIQSVDTTLTLVTIDGTTYEVVGAENRARFEGALEECGLDEAAQAFHSWRMHRTLTNVFLVGIVVQPLWIGSVVFAALAPGPRMRMVLALEDRGSTETVAAPSNSDT